MDAAGDITATEITMAWRRPSVPGLNAEVGIVSFKEISVSEEEEKDVSSIKNPFWVPLCLLARGGKKGVRRRGSLRIPVSVRFLQESAILLTYIGDFAFVCGNGEVAICFC
jgi:hypothetical protein